MVWLFWALFCLHNLEEGLLLPRFFRVVMSCGIFKNSFRRTEKAVADGGFRFALFAVSGLGLVMTFLKTFFPAARGTGFLYAGFV